MSDDTQSSFGNAHTVRVQQLFVANQNAVRGFILSLVVDFTAADDILQEVFLVVTRKAATFGEGTNFTAWACAIAKLKVLEWRRQRQSQPLMLSESVIESLAECVPVGALGEDRAAALLRCMDRLAPRALEMVRLRYYAGCGPQEIARRLAWTPDAVNVAMSKARAFLRTCVDRAMRRSED